MKPTTPGAPILRELSGKPFPFGTKQGKSDYERLVANLPAVEGVIRLDMTGLEVVDTAWAREVVGRLIENAGDDTAFYIDNVTENVEENVDAALFRMGLSVLSRRSTGRWKVIGKPVSEELDELLRLLKKRVQATPRQLVEAIGGLSMTACNNRLRELLQRHLIVRVESPPSSGGRQYAYRLPW